jgi:hypothetical protein
MDLVAKRLSNSGRSSLATSHEDRVKPLAAENSVVESVRRQRAALVRAQGSPLPPALNRKRLGGM